MNMKLDKKQWGYQPQKNHSKNCANLYVVMEFWLNSNLVLIIVWKQILYLQNNMLKKISRFKRVLEHEYLSWGMV